MCFVTVAFAQADTDASSPVTILPDNSMARITTVITDRESGRTQIVVQDEPVMYDALSGEPVTSQRSDEEEEEPSLRDQVRSKMKMLEE